MKKLFHFYFVILLVYSETTAAQNWQTYYNRDTKVTVQTFSAPYLWYYSINGLSRRNVLTNEVITFTSANSPIASMVTVINVRAGQTWVGSEMGIGVYDGSDWIFYPRSLYTPNQESVSSIAFHPDGNVWVSGFHSIARFDGTNWKIFGAPDGLPYPDPNFPLFHVENIRITDTGTVWINTMETGSGMNNTTKGLIKYENNAFTVFSLPGHANENIYDFDLVTNNLIVTTDAGTYKVEGNQVTHSYTRNNAPLIVWGDGVFDGGGITAGAGDYFWTNVDNNLIKVMTTGEITEYSYESLQLKSQYVFGVAEESIDTFWVGTSSGLLRVSPKGNTSIEIVEGVPNIPSFYFRKIIKDFSGNLWLGTDAGLLKKTGNAWTVYNKSNSVLQSDAVNDLALDANGNLWVATGTVTWNQIYSSEGGLTKISPQGTMTTMHSGNSQMPNNVVNKLSIDPNGNLWASLGTSYDQSYFLIKLLDNNGTITIPTIISGATNGLPKSDATDMLFDNSGNLWLSFHGTITLSGQSASPALAKYNGNNWTWYHPQNANFPSSQSLVVSALTKSPNGDLFFLTSYDGFYNGKFEKYDGVNFTSYPLPSKIVGDSFYGNDIQIDNNGKYWIAAYRGLASYDLTNQSWAVYDAQNSPLPKYDANSFQHTVYSIYVDDQNTKYFGCFNDSYTKGVNGLAIYNEAGFGTKQTQTITFSQADKAFATAPLLFSLQASATSGLPVTFELMQGQAAINGSMLTVNEPGSITVRASQAGDNTYEAASPVLITFCINPTKPVISRGEDKLFIPAVATGQVQWYKDNVTVNNTSNTPTEFYPGENGSYKVKVTVNGCATFSDTEVVNRQTQTITIEEISDKIFGEAPTITVATHATSELPVSLQLVKGNIQLIGNTATINAPGEVEIKAIQAGNLQFLAANSVTVSFCVNPAKPIIQIENATILKATPSGGSWQWYLNDEVLAGAVQASYQPSNGQTGIYKVKVVQGNCYSFSEPIPFTVTDVEKTSNSLFIFPNPTTKSLFIKCDASERIYCTINSIHGLELRSGFLDEREIDVSEYRGQLIMVTLRTGALTVVKKVMVN